MANLIPTRVGNPTVFGDKKVGVFNVPGPASYTTAGNTLALADVGLNLRADLVLVSQRNGIIVEPVYATDGTVKLKFMHPTGGATAATAAADAPTATGTQGAVTQPTISVPVATGANAAHVAAGGVTVTSNAADPVHTITQPTISAPIATGAAVAAPTVALKAGVGKEVGSTVDLSALTWRLVVIGS